MVLLYNFQPVQEEALSLSYLNRGFQYNDGLFDTLIFTDGRIRFLHDHLDRLRRALAVLGLSLPEAWLEEAWWRRQVSFLIRENALTAPVIRIKANIWRKPGGLFTPETDQAEILVTASAQAELPAVIGTAGMVDAAPVPYSPFSFFKGPYALHYVQAGRAKKQAGWDEGILLDARGHIAEALVSNIFWLKGPVLYTPSLETGCIAGIMRLNVLRACQMLRLEVREGFFREAELLAADLVFTSNVTGLRPIAAIGQTCFQTNSAVFQRLQEMVLSPYH
jgi:branched-subunit amino acid aminotransferase/4-amino-4-deoxychorismate lyase